MKNDGMEPVSLAITMPKDVSKWMWKVQKAYPLNSIAWIIVLAMFSVMGLLFITLGLVGIVDPTISELWSSKMTTVFLESGGVFIATVAVMEIHRFYRFKKAIKADRQS